MVREENYPAYSWIFGHAAHCILGHARVQLSKQDLPSNRRGGGGGGPIFRSPLKYHNKPDVLNDGGFV